MGCAASSWRNWLTAWRILRYVGTYLRSDRTHILDELKVIRLVAVDALCSIRVSVPLEAWHLSTLRKHALAGTCRWLVALSEDEWTSGRDACSDRALAHSLPRLPFEVLTNVSWHLLALADGRAWRCACHRRSFDARRVPTRCRRAHAREL